jgi:hypothetical protein
MKYLLNKSKILLTIVFINLSFSCSEDFIDLAPVSSANVNSFYQNQGDFETAIVGIYSSWQSLYSTPWIEWTEYRGDTHTWGNGLKYEISENNFNINQTFDLWNRLYRIVALSNALLGRIDDVSFTDESVKDRMKGEARFFRAEAYFALVRFFGGVPLIEDEVSSTEALEIGRSNALDVYDFIEADYLFAISNLPETVDSDQYGRITKYGAEGELARVYITLSGAVHNQDRWSDAIPLLEDVLFSSPHAFSETYAEIFAEDGSNEKGEEVILSALFKSGTEGEASGYATQFTVYAQGTNSRFESGVYESYESGDLRRDVNMVTSYTSLEGVFFNHPANVKFDLLYDPTTQNSGMDFPILRYTDLYLLYAEALAEISGNVTVQALDILNEVRDRADLASLTVLDVPNIDSFRIAMEKERRSELMFECVRWFDLVRTGRAVEALNALGKEADETWLIYPIPQIEIDKIGGDLLPQNPGYH